MANLRIVLAPNAFKGSLSPVEAARAMAEGARAAAPRAEIVRAPVADGGDGFAEVVCRSLGGRMLTAEVTGPRRRPVEARWCHVPSLGLAALEMAQASGIALLPDELRDPALTTTLGTGELIARALDAGCTRIVVGIGGSATVDGGTGAAAALGVRFLDAGGGDVEPVGGELVRIARVDVSGLDPRLAAAGIEVACDAANPLLGAKGAARVYAPQKGATPGQVELLEAGLAGLAEVIERDLGTDVTELAGAGAAGGLGAGMAAFLGARLRSGAELVLDLVRLDEALRGADLVITGEGKLDRQTAFGKAPRAVAAHARRLGVVCYAVAGALEATADELRAMGIDAAFALTSDTVSIEESMRRAGELLRETTAQAVRRFLVERA